MTKKNIIIFVLVVGLTLIFWSSILLQEYFSKIVNLLQGYGNLYPTLSILVFIGLSALSTMISFFSSVLLVPVAIVLWNNPLTVSFLLAGWLIGATFSYLIGRYGGYPLVLKFTSAKQVEYYHRLFAEQFSFRLIFLFRLILPSEIPGYALGIVQYPFAKYFLVTFLAELPFAIYAVYAIESIIDKKQATLAVATAIWLIAAWILFYFYRREIKIKNKNAVN